MVRGEEDMGVRFYSFGKTVYQALLTYINDPDYGDITHIETGRDIVVDYTPQDKSDTNFAKTTILVKPNQTPVSKDAELVERWTTKQPNLTTLFKEPSYEELSVVLKRYLDPNSADEDTSVTETVVAPATVQASSSDKVKSAVDEFESLFAE